jgi:hypothetical protein
MNFCPQNQQPINPRKVLHKATQQTDPNTCLSERQQSIINLTKWCFLGAHVPWWQWLELYLVMYNKRTTFPSRTPTKTFIDPFNPLSYSLSSKSHTYSITVSKFYLV